MAVAPYRQGMSLGWVPAPGVSSMSASSSLLNLAANWTAISFVPDSARTLSAVRTFISSATGTLASADVTCDLYDSAGSVGSPGAAIESGKLPSATVTAAGWYDFTGFTTALTAGQQYWAVWKNVNAVPASNFPTFRLILNAVSAQFCGSALNRQGWGNATSANSGSTWSVQAHRTCLRVSYADGSYDGVPIGNTAAAAVGDGVYSARESGVKFTAPANGVLKILGLAMYVNSKTGTPTGSPRLGLWTGSTPSNLAYTNTIPATAITMSQWVYAYFAATQTIQPGTICRVTLGETAQADASTNRWNNQEVIWDTDANSLAMLPWEGTCVKTYFDGTSTWTDTSGSVFGHALLLDPAGEFGAGAGGVGSLTPFPSGQLHGI